MLRMKHRQMLISNCLNPIPARSPRQIRNLRRIQIVRRSEPRQRTRAKDTQPR